MPTAYSILPDRFEDGRHTAILNGLARQGYAIVYSPYPPADDRDLLVTWTVHKGGKEDQARQFEAQGGRVLVCEEAYIRNVNGEKCFALALSEHNGGGIWPEGGPERWESFGIELKPWRNGGDYILVAGQRGIGSMRMASPANWHDDTVRRLAAITDRPIKVRPHPKSRQGPLPTSTLEEDIASACAVVVWSSSTGVKSLIDGIPTFFDAPAMSVQGAAEHGITNIDNPTRPDRLPAFRRMAWGQWSVSEIESGKAFEWLRNE